MDTSNQPHELSADERAELEELREQKRERERREQIQKEREELTRLRLEQERKEEYRAIAYEAACDRVAREEEQKKVDAQYEAGEIPPMPRKQKIILSVLAVIFLVGVGYVLRFYGFF